MSRSKSCAKCGAVPPEVELRSWGNSSLCVSCKKTYDRECRERSKAARGIQTSDRSPELTETGQLCKTCRADKPMVDFYKNTNVSSGFARECKACVAARRKRVRDEQAIPKPPRVRVAPPEKTFPQPCRFCSVPLEESEARPWGQQFACVECKRAYQRSNAARYRARRGQAEAVPTPSDSETQVCSTCQEQKPWDAFYRNLSYASGFESKCVECRKTRRRKIWAENIGGHRDRDLVRSAATPEYVLSRDWASRLLKVYNITEEQYWALHKAQGGVCACCQLPEERVHLRTGKLVRLSVDHDHACCSGMTSCGKCVRGLLCHSCNIGLGRLEFRGADLQKVADYVRDHPGQAVLAVGV